MTRNFRDRALRRGGVATARPKRPARPEAPAPAQAGPLDFEKERLRASMRAALRRLRPGAAAEAGQQIADGLGQTAEWAAADRIALYSHLPGEVDSGPIWAAARGAGKVVLFPRMIPGQALEFARADDASQLCRGRFNVLEPDSECEVLPLAGDALVLIPGLAFDRAGGRLGRGAGYYDRALAGADAEGAAVASERPLRIGIGFELQIVSRIPMGRYDMRMDQVWTEGARPEGGGGLVPTAPKKYGKIGQETDPQ